MTSIQDAIRARQSVRTYQPKPLSPEHITALMQKISQVNSAPCLVRHGVTIHLLGAGVAADGKLGTYGVIRGAKHFLCVTANPGDDAAAVIGYGLEQVILHAASLGLGTCWLAGTFSRGQFGRALTIPEGQVMPIVSPIGYPAERPSLVHRVMAMAAKSRQRKPWEELFFQRDFHTPLTRQAAGAFAPVLDMVQLAPSAENFQPWRILKNGSGYHFYRARKQKLPLSYDVQVLDVGIAACHFGLTAGELGLPGKFYADDTQKTLSTEDMKYICTWG